MAKATKPEPKELPAPEEEKELSAPDEKLLPEPTFWQQYGKVLKYVFLSLVLVVCVSSGSYLALNKQSLFVAPEPTVTPAPSQVACESDAKICPDGSSVGRVGPKCEFAACPAGTSVVLPTEDPTLTASWSIYTNQNGAYLFKYPKNYQLNVGKAYGVDGVESKSPNLTSLLSPTIFTDSSDGNGGKTNFQMQVSFINNSQNYSLEQLPEKTDNCTYFNEHKGKHLLIDNIDALWFEDTPCGPRGQSILFTTNGGLIYQIIFESTAPYTDFNSVADQILSTFKFTDQTAVSPTCRPRPACLDATPRCMIAETPDMCPSTVTPAQNTSPTSTINGN